MRRIKVSLNIGLGVDRKDVLEFDESATEEEIEDVVNDRAYNYINIGWSEEPL